MDRFASVATAAALLSRPAPAAHETSAHVSNMAAAEQHLQVQREHFQRLEERMDDMQSNILRTQQMIRDLNALMHRQLKVRTSSAS